MDDRLVAGEAGEVTVFWAAVSWLEAERSRRRDADEASKPHCTFLFCLACILFECWRRAVANTGRKHLF